MAEELQVIPARHGVATFVPAGQTIKIINTSGGQVVDTWAFALPTPEAKKGSQEEKDEKAAAKKTEESKSDEASTPSKSAGTATPAKKATKKDGNDLPSQEDAEKATQELMSKGQDAKENATPQKSTWSSYVPSLGLTSKKTETPKKAETQEQKNSRTWASYFPSGKGFSNYIPKSASDTVSSFAKDHQRDQSKSYLEQLQDFSKTPVGAAGVKVMTGSGYSSSLYAGYQAYNAAHAADAPAMEFMSMPHTRAASLHMVPKVNDSLVSNLREPMLTLVEDTSPGIHDTLIAACDPQRYKGLGVDEWEKHGSCAENLVLALKELNERAGLKGAKGVGADVTINAVPAPLNLFMNIPWDNEGDLGFKAPKTKAGDYVRLKAERDVVVVMSACPQDILDINNRKPTDAHFLVEGDEPAGEAIKRTQAQPVKKKGTPRKLDSSRRQSQSTASVSVAADDNDDTKANATSQPAKRPAPPKKAVSTQKKPSVSAASGDAAPAPAAPAAAAPKKKPAPAPVKAQKKPSVSAQGAAPAAADATGGAANGTATPPVEKKKPRKLATKPKAATAGAAAAK